MAEDRKNQPPANAPAMTAAGHIAPLDKVKITLGVVGTLAGVCVILVMIAILAHRAVTAPQIAGVKTPAEREEMLRKARADDRETLSTYGWVDRQKGVVRIPIEEAMQKFVAEGGALPATAPAASQPERKP